MAATKYVLWNAALSCLKETKTVSDATTGLPTDQCNLHWDRILAEVLKAFAWPFATKQAELSEYAPEWSAATTYASGALVTSDGVVYSSKQANNTNHAVSSSAWWLEAGPVKVGWEYCYALPSDCLTPLAFLSEGERLELQAQDEQTVFARQARHLGDGEVLLCDTGPDDFDVLEYTALITTTTVYPADFEAAVIARLAAQLALSLPGETERYAFWMKEYLRTASVAKCQALNQRRPAQPPMTPLERLRS